MTRFYELTATGAFVCDADSSTGLSNWTRIVCPDGLYQGRLQGASRLPTGEWVGGTWVGSPMPVYKPSRAEVEASRQRAYADPLTGSDRLFNEARRMQDMGESGWEDVKAQAQARFLAIQAAFPWPE